MKNILLEAANLTKTFGGVTALDDVDISVEANKITAIIGPNGAGKTTLFNLIAGVYSPTKGDILMDGKSLNHKSPEARVMMGIARTFQDVRLFGNMSAIENVMTGRHSRSRRGFLDAALRLPSSQKEEEDIYLQAMRFLNLVGLGDKAQENALSIPFGQQKLVAIARAMASEPKLVMLDEPGSGLNALEKESLGELIQRIRDLGTTVLLVEHDVNMVMRIAEWVVVLDYGQKISEGTPNQVRKDPKVIAAYLGEGNG
jgi:branched-chain amino acid transport system ATP-binding protein